MDNKFIHNRICELLESKRRSLRQASLDLGYSESYMNGVVNGRIELKTSLLLDFCKYVDISPADFFNPSFPSDDSSLDKDIFLIIQKMNPNEKKYVYDFLKRFNAYQKNVF